MLARIKHIIIAAIVIILISCNKKHDFLISNETYVYLNFTTTYDSILLKKFLTENKIYALIFIDGECPSCILELSKWEELITEHKFLNPIFIVNANYPKIFLQHINNLCLCKYPIIIDQNYKIVFENKLNPEKPLLLINNQMNILFYGDPFLDYTFRKFYKKQLLKS